ncbi:subtilisin-like protein [Mycena albidolilacea]|uniref:Subtilisin-like protein n=1 Tax=Mycena albidolilacea TaxID=1033008 RepID=A0AAD6ZF18_9AGAR|nr:subtilisin-like protein [Mycena albidolilacea]
MRLSSLFPFATIFAVASANPMGRAMAVHESVAAVPSGFAHAGSVSPDQQITLRIALAQSDIAGLQAKTYAVSNPANALYGQHLTVDEVAKFVRPTSVTISEVSEWLSEHGITAKNVSPAGDLLQITVSVNKANALLGAQFSAFTHSATGKSSIRTLSYSLPASLQSHIRFVHPTVAFVPPLGAPSLNAVEVKRDVVEKRAAPISDAVPASCASVANPACIEAIYGFPADKANNSAQNVLGVAGYIDQFANFADVALFLRNLRPDLVGSNFTVVEIDGGENDQGNAGVEANLDIEMTISLAGGVPVSFISVGDDSQDDVDGFIDIVNSILATPIETRPTVLTTSYGFNEQDLPPSLAIGICDAYTQLAAAGISVLFASGDGGVGGVQPTECTTFVPTAPGGCPFITSVGGSTGVPPQVAASLSGGGFSNVFSIPDYQANDVATYISSIGDQYAGLYNSTGRGIPDVALQALNVEIAWLNSFWLVGGTSCASPIFAAMIALVNDRLIAAGKPVLGFLNPFLYSPAGRAAFTDVTSGNNPGCDTDGFSAGPGWDPVTGLGTPSFSLLLRAAGL